MIETARILEHVDQPGVIAVAYEHEDDDSCFFSLTVVVMGSTPFSANRFPLGYQMDWSKRKNWKPFDGEILWSVIDGEAKVLTLPSNTV